MYGILVVDSGAIDREMTLKILSNGLEGPVEFFSATDSDEAYTIMKDNRIDLLIADVPEATAYVKKLVRTAYTLHQHIHVILTSVQSEDKIAQLTNKISAECYLLKPFRARQLLDAVRPLEAMSHAAQVKADHLERDRRLNSIASYIEECEYKKCIETAKEYIDFIYGAGDNMSIVRMRIVEFAAELVELGRPYNQETRQRLNLCLERFRSRFDLQSNRFEATSVIEQLLDMIFAEMERSQLYSDDDMKKVLNYIDRNIKKGVTLDEAAEYINMSSSYFSKLFKKSAGINFITYITDRKIEFAKEMLENTNMPVINIAYELSYNETNYFSKAFKRKVGVTPTEYRERCLLETRAAGN